MTIWKFTKDNNKIKVARSNDDNKSYSLGEVNDSVLNALRSVALWVQPNDIIDLGGIEETIVFKYKTGVLEKKKTQTFIWNHIPVLMGGIQGLPRN
jgi:hypothetical protein